MTDASTSVVVTLPPALMAEVQAAAHVEHRSIADLLLVLVEQGLSDRRLKAGAEQDLQRGRPLGLTDGGQAMAQTIDEKIMDGLESARQGRLVDGDAVFAKIYAELDALPRG